MGFWDGKKIIEYHQPHPLIIIIYPTATSRAQKWNQQVGTNNCTHTSNGYPRLAPKEEEIPIDSHVRLRDFTHRDKHEHSLVSIAICQGVTWSQALPRWQQLSSLLSASNSSSETCRWYMASQIELCFYVIIIIWMCICESVIKKYSLSPQLLFPVINLCFLANTVNIFSKSSGKFALETRKVSQTLRSE